MAEEEWMPEAYDRLSVILDQIEGARGLSAGKVATIKELVKNNPEMYMNPQGLANLYRGLLSTPSRSHWS